MTDELTPAVPDRRPLTKTDYRRYDKLVSEIKTDIDMIEQALFRVGRNLKLIRDRQLYFCGGYVSFADFCQKELGNSRQQAYRLIQAHDVIQNLLHDGIPEHDLPQSERLCREIRKLKPDEQTRVWKAVMRQVGQRGRPATVIDVQTVAAEELKSASAIDRQQTELIQKFESVNRSLKVGLHYDTLTPAFRLRLIATLSEITQTVTTLICSLRSKTIDERIQSEAEGDDEAEAEGNDNAKK